MSAIAPRRKGWPLRPLAERVGVRGRCGRWRPATGSSPGCGRREGDCRSIRRRRWPRAQLRCGNGAIGLSARGNLHLRGLSERTLADLHARLSDARLIDADPEIERLRNIVASPLDDLDPEALLDLSAERGCARDAARRGRGSAPVAGQVQLRPRRARAPAARRRRRGHSLRGVARRDARGVSRRRGRAGRGMRARRDGRSRSAPRTRLHSPRRRRRGRAAADARARRAARGERRVRRGRSRGQAARAFAAARLARRSPRRARIRRQGRCRRGGGVRRNRGRPRSRR